jgi:glycerol-3-phosphate dehydrogenase
MHVAPAYDLAIIGGGINGCGIARDAAGRGLAVHLCEMGDLASGTSSRSTKLIHGGLRYLEYYDFRLVREALREREVLWRLAPHVVRPLRLVLPYRRGLRPAWLLRLGLLVYFASAPLLRSDLGARFGSRANSERVTVRQLESNETPRSSERGVSALSPINRRCGGTR